MEAQVLSPPQRQALVTTASRHWEKKNQCVSAKLHVHRRSPLGSVTSFLDQLVKSIMQGECIVPYNAMPGSSDASAFAYGKCSHCSLRTCCEAVMKRMELLASMAALQPVAVQGV